MPPPNENYIQKTLCVCQFEIIVRSQELDDMGPGISGIKGSLFYIRDFRIDIKAMGLYS